MENQYFNIEVGDQVMIHPDYWAQCCNGNAFIEPYCTNGQDYVYTVVEICEKTAGGLGVRFRVDAPGKWVNRSDHIMPLAKEHDIEGTGDISMLLK